MSEHKERKTLEERQQMSDLERLRHSCAHVLATAICRLCRMPSWPAGLPWITGFITTWSWTTASAQRTLNALRRKMKKVVKENQVFQKEVISARMP